tara:strand:- start:176 stop:520 length:345 start_codon:yes stop_codon:yes gene_type:complete
MTTEETEQLRRLRDSLRAAVEAANLVHVHADERGTFGLVRRALALVEGDAPFDAWARQGEWPSDEETGWARMEADGEPCEVLDCRDDCLACDGEGTPDGVTDCNQCGGTGRLPF